jgi:hypothetical protein
MVYDIIGDIHGHAEALAALLDKMGYRRTNGIWRQDNHTPIFVGDFIDRGPGQLETLDIVRPMIDEGYALAVMGNHEFNAIAWHTPDPMRPGQHLREHSEKNQKQHQALLDGMAVNPELLPEVINWFYKLPLWIKLPGLRVVHACWHPEHMRALAPLLEPGQRLNPQLVEAACRHGTTEFSAIETILKGPEATLPEGLSFNVGGETRYEVHTRWWDAKAVTFRESAIVDSATRALLPDIEIPEDLRFGYKSYEPVLIGHYWMRGPCQLLSPRVACVDYSVAKGGPLVAYRWRGESDLDATHFIST